MPAPTALQRRPEELAENVAMDTVSVPTPADQDTAMDTDELIDMNAMPQDAPQDAQDAPAAQDLTTDESGRPKFAPAKNIPLAFRREQRKVPIPPHRMTPLKSAWPKIYVRFPVAC
jgi:RNA-binding protein PNO1